MIVDFGVSEIVLQLGGRRVCVPYAARPEGEGGPDVVVNLDDVTHWQAPHAAEDISLDDLQKIAGWIERACDKRGLDVAFE